VKAFKVMETIEKNVNLLLNGQDAEEVQDFCDFTLEDQNEAAGKCRNLRKPLFTASSICFLVIQEFNVLFIFENAVSKGLAPSAPPDFVPVLRQSVCYVVMAVIINDQNEILMMQEAKSSCAGQWYLPAGRVEPQETIAVILTISYFSSIRIFLLIAFLNSKDAFKREVLEETGFQAEPSTLLMVESAAGSWYRFVMAGNVTGMWQCCFLRFHFPY